MKKVNEAAKNFDFIELGQAIMKAREQQRITREELAEELGISARHLQAVEKEGQNPSFPLFIQLVTMFHISVDPYIHPDLPTKKTTLRRQLDLHCVSFLIHSSRKELSCFLHSF